MYLEAYGIIEKKPGMLKKLGEFEVSLLHFICREGLLDEEIIRHITDLAGREKKYSKHLQPPVFPILMKQLQKIS